jgi:hypothetical protein
MQIRVLFSYTEKNVIPKGCRKPRNVRHDDGERLLEVREVASTDAPIALRVTPANTFHRYDHPLEYRWLDGKLWLPFQAWYPSGTVPALKPEYNFVGRWGSEFQAAPPYRTFASREDVERLLDSWAAGTVLIDGVQYIPIDHEPYWRVFCGREDYSDGGSTRFTAPDSWKKCTPPATWQGRSRI